MAYRRPMAMTWRLVLAARDRNGAVVFEHRIALGELRARRDAID